MLDDWMNSLLLAAVLCIQIVACSEARSQSLTREQAMYLYAIAYGHVGHIPDSPPHVQFVPRSRLCEIAGLPSTCRLSGLEQSGSVYVRDDLDMASAYDASIVLHEFVHYVQHSKGGEPRTCEERIRRELEAYDVQIAALERIGADPRQAMRGRAMVGTCS